MNILRLYRMLLLVPCVVFSADPESIAQAD